MFNPDRDQARGFFVSAWRKHRAGEAKTPLESLAAAIAAAHPELHALLENEAAALQQEWPGLPGRENPFLHLSLHLAVAEQLSIDRPPGIRAAFNACCAHSGLPHAAEHVLMDCLEGELRRAQQQQCAADALQYLACVEKCSRQTPNGA